MGAPESSPRKGAAIVLSGKYADDEEHAHLHRWEKGKSGYTGRRFRLLKIDQDQD